MEGLAVDHFVWIVAMVGSSHYPESNGKLMNIELSRKQPTAWVH